MSSKTNGNMTTLLPPLKPGDFKLRRAALVAVCARYGYTRDEVGKLVRAGVVATYHLPDAPARGKAGKRRAAKLQRGHYLASDVAAALGQPLGDIVALAKGMSV